MQSPVVPVAPPGLALDDKVLAKNQNEDARYPTGDERVEKENA